MQSTGGMCWHVKFNRVWSSGSLGGRHQDLSHCLKTCIRVWCSSLGSPKKAVRSSQLPHVAMILHPIAVTIFTYLHYSLFQVVEHSKISLPSKEKTGRFCQRRSQAPGPCNYLVRNTSLQRCPGSDGQPAGIKMNESSWQAKKCGCLDTPEICFFCSAYECHGSLWSEMNC